MSPKTSKQHIRLNFSAALTILVTSLLCTSYRVDATNYIWTGNGANQNWINSTNWFPNTGSPVAGDTAIINTNGSPTTLPSQNTTLNFNTLMFTNSISVSTPSIGMAAWAPANGVAGIYTNVLVGSAYPANVGINFFRNSSPFPINLPPGTNYWENLSSRTVYVYANVLLVQAKNAGQTSQWVIDGPGVWILGANTSDVLQGTILTNGPGILQIVKNGTGALKLMSTVTNSSSGGFILNNGQVVINNGGNPSATGFATNSALGTGTFTINGGSIENTSGGDLTLSSANRQVWNGDFSYGGSFFNFNLGIGSVTLSNTVQVTVSNNTLSVDGVIGGASKGITKAGLGTLALNGANTYTGNTTINAGTLSLGASGSLSSSSTLNIGAGGTFDVSSQATWTLGGTASLVASGNASAAQINGQTTVDFGSRPVTLNYDGVNAALTVTSGALNLNGGITVSNATGSALTDGTYTVINVNSGTITGTPYLNGFVLGAGIVGGSGAAIQISGGQIQLVIQPAVATTTTIARHTGTGSSSTYGDALQFDVTVSGGSTPTGTVTVKDGGAGGTTIGSGTLSSGSATVTLNPLNSLAIGSHANIVAVYNGDGSHIGSTSTALSPVQSVGSKALTVSGAAVQSKYYDATTSATITGTLSGVVSGDTVTLIGTGTFANAGPGAGIAVTSSSTLGGASASNYTLTQPTGLTGTIYGSGTPGVWTGTAGTGFWETAGNWNNNAVPAGFNVTADFSTLDITTDQTVNLTTTETIGNLIFGDSNTGTAAGWTLANNGNTANTLTLASASPTVTVNALGSGKTATISAVMAGNAGLTKNGNGTLVLNGINTYSGSTVISAGTVKAGTANAFGTTTALTVQSGATLDLNGQSLNNLGFSITAAGNGVGGIGAITNAVFQNSSFSNLVLTADTAVSAGAQFTVRVNDPAAPPILDMGGHTLTKLGSGIFSLISAANNSITNPGNMVVSAGTLQWGFGFPGNGVAPGQTNYTITVNNGATLEFYKNSAPNVTYNIALLNGATISWSGATNTSNLAGNLTLNGTDTFLMNTNGTYKGVIGGSGNLVKAGPAPLILAGTNTYSGNTTVSNGTLAVAYHNFAANSTISIVSGGFLQLDTTITNSITNLVLNGVSQPLGVYNSANAAPYITGAGSLQVALPSAPSLPVFSPVAGSYYGAQSVTISSTPGATIIYTTDGTDPTVSGTAITNVTPVSISVPVNVTRTIKAYATSGGLNSSVATATYSTTLAPAVPTFSPAGGAYPGAVTVTMSSSVGSTITYTTDGSDPTTSGTAVSGATPVALSVSAGLSKVVKAYAKTGALSSSVATASYNTTLPVSSITPMLASTNDSALRNNYTGTVGYRFTTSSGQILVTSLGYSDWTGLGLGGSGLVTTHQVGIWSTNGTLLGSVTVPAGTAGNLVNHFWYAALSTPLTLAPNTTYVIGASVNSSDYWPGSTGSYSPGYSAPVFTGFSALSDANAVFGSAFPAMPANPDGTGTSVWPLVNLLGSAPTPVVVQPIKLGDGSMQFSVLGTAGSSYRIWATTNLALTPITSTWSNVSSGTFTGSYVNFTDTQATNYPARFYSITVP